MKNNQSIFHKLILLENHWTQWFNWKNRLLSDSFQTFTIFVLPLSADLADSNLPLANAYLQRSNICSFVCFLTSSTMCPLSLAVQSLLLSTVRFLNASTHYCCALQIFTTNERHCTPCTAMMLNCCHWKSVMMLLTSETVGYVITICEWMIIIYFLLIFFFFYNASPSNFE